MASEADVIASLYFDVMDIYRKEKTIDDNGISVLTEVLKYSNIECSLDKKDEISATGEVGVLVGAYKLFCRPTIDIQVGDKLMITYSGITKEFEAGEPFPYKSHLEVPLTKAERV